jgi:hypothetical protein
MWYLLKASFFNVKWATVFNKAVMSPLFACFHRFQSKEIGNQKSEITNHKSVFQYFGYFSVKSAVFAVFELVTNRKITFTNPLQIPKFHAPHSSSRRFDRTGQPNS